MVYCICQMNSSILAAIVLNLPNPRRKPGGCYEQETGYLKGGQKKTLPEKCIQALCSPDGSMEYMSCGVAHIDKKSPCYKRGDPKEPYPKCCDRLTCV
ncbi:hypothetical protein Zmor_005058 [Zophobas morio]|uniref:Single domain-containing protein n=1 Tax=Zophobas morio TaxID=2755281 RepID=A0AA38ITP8_9CUCU|nr:hypothetical protein Zmor_005058 [Zophobas morio]